MLGLPSQFILFDTEYTAWEGSQDRKWTGPNEHREIVQMGAIKVARADLSEEDDFLKFIKPKFNPKLSNYFISLTHIAQETVDKEGVGFPSAVAEFKQWCGELPVYSFGHDGEVVMENCALLNIECPFPSMQFHTLQGFFKSNGIPTEEYYSSTITEAFGEKPSRQGHDALNDARTILDGLRLLEKQKRP